MRSTDLDPISRQTAVLDLWFAIKKGKRGGGTGDIAGQTDVIDVDAISRRIYSTGRISMPTPRAQTRNPSMGDAVRIHKPLPPERECVCLGLAKQMRLVCSVTVRSAVRCCMCMCVCDLVSVWWTNRGC